MAQPSATRRCIGRYELVRTLCHGASATLYLARPLGEPAFRKLVVVKTARRDGSRDSSALQSLLREARVASQLNHPNVVQVFDGGYDDGVAWLAMEYLHGEDLASVLREADLSGRRPSFGIICRIVSDLLAALECVHQATAALSLRPGGLVHRHLSPKNVIVTFTGHVKLIDFGIVKEAGAAPGLDTTVPGQPKGDLPYLSPEQARCEPVDARSDVFAAGVVLWEMATGARLFARESAAETLRAIETAEIPAPSRINGTVPEGLEKILRRALARRPEQRYPNAARMRADLEALITMAGWPSSAAMVERYMGELFAARLEAERARRRIAGELGEPAAALVPDLTSVSDPPALVEEKTRRVARDALQELEITVVAPGTPLGDETVVTAPGRVSDATDVVTPISERTPPPRRRPRRGARVAVIALSAALTVGAAFALQTPEGRALVADLTAAIAREPARPPVAVAATSAPPSDEEAAAVDDEAPPDESESAPATARIDLEADDPVEVSIDGVVVSSGQRRALLDVAPNRPHRVAYRKTTRHTTRTVTVPTLAPGETTTLRLRTR